MEVEGMYWSNSSLVYNSQRKNAISTEQTRERGETYLDAILDTINKALGPRIIIIGMLSAPTLALYVCRI